MSFKIMFIASERTPQSFCGGILIIKTNTVYHSSPKAFSRPFLEVSDSDNLQREIASVSRSESTLWDFQNNVLGFELQKRSRLGYFVSKSFFQTRTPLEVSRYNRTIPEVSRCRDFAYSNVRFSERPPKKRNS